LHFLQTFSAQLGQALALYGGWGLFAISFLDSSFLSFPAINDILLIHLSSLHPTMSIAYALDCAVGSVLGAYLIFVIARRGAKSMLRASSSQRMQRLERWLKRNDFLSVLVASLLPPPAPFKIFALTAGALRVNTSRFCVALLAGRTLRFTVEGFLGARFGAGAEGYLRGNAGWVSLLISVFLILITVLQRRFRSRREEDSPKAPGHDPAALP
jgi:membrane protein YqaA with SNARE-associated domain